MSQWVVWSYEHTAWWAPSQRGYTEQLERAGRYSEAEAKEIERAANMFGQRNELALSLDRAMMLYERVPPAATS